MAVMVFGAAGLLMLGGFMLASLSEMMSNGCTLSREEFRSGQADTTIFLRYSVQVWKYLIEYRKMEKAWMYFQRYSNH